MCKYNHAGSTLTFSFLSDLFFSLDNTIILQSIVFGLGNFILPFIIIIIYSLLFCALNSSLGVIYLFLVYGGTRIKSTIK